MPPPPSNTRLKPGKEKAKMSLQPQTSPTLLERLERIKDIASSGLPTDSVTSADARLEAEIRHYLDETADFDKALSILVKVGDELGLVLRDPEGHFQQRKATPDVDADDDADVIQPGRKVRQKAKPAKSRKKLSAAARRAAAHVVNKIASAAFDFMTRDDVALGDIYYSQITGRMGVNAVETKIYEGLLAYGQPATDMPVRDYVPEAALTKIIADATATA
jgi:hypothetical protein